MSCDEWQKIWRMDKKVKALEKGQGELRSETQNGFNRIAEVLTRIEQQLTVLEQAVVDPDSEAAAALRKKHGIGKQGPVRPIGALGKKG